MNLSRIGASALVAASLAGCGGTIAYGPSSDDASSDAATTDAGTPDAITDHATTIVCLLVDDAGDTISHACGDWVSVDTIDYEVVDAGKKFNHETPCSGGVCIGTSCGVPDDAGVIAVVGSCETVP